MPHPSKWIRREKRHAIYRRDDLTCVYCGRTCEERILTLDHIVSRELGGGNGAENVVTACLSCNSSKQHRSIRAFLRFLRQNGVNCSGMARRIRNAVKRRVPR